MNASALVRPGLRMGMRPERREPCDVDRFDLAWARWFSHKVDPRLISLAAFSAVLGDIEAAEKRYAQLDVAARNSALLDTRYSLRSKNRDHHVLADAFGFIQCGLQKTLGMRFHNQQLYAGWCLHEGHFVEMQTGEGKTLTAALPAIAMAMAGVPVHVITSNEYLAQRDLDSLLPLYNWFGLNTDVVLSGQDDKKRQEGYACDITYCTHQQVVFDYLRDTRLLGNQRACLSAQIHELLQEETPEVLQRGLCFAIVDEADSVLIDDARTPLILAESDANHNESGAEAAVALAIARTLKKDEHFEIDTRNRQIELADSGVRIIEQQVVMLNGIWNLPRYRDEKIIQALVALHLFHKDKEYLIVENTIVLIDQSTGRPTPRRRLQHGLQRMIEVKERCLLSEETVAVSALSFQRFFTRYHTLSGMSGTLRESRHELRRVYGPKTLTVPTVRDCLRKTLCQVVHATRDEQLTDMLKQVVVFQKAQRAVLIGTRTVSFSEIVSKELTHAGIAHVVLNAHQDEDEALAIAQAGEPGRITVATNMAGRGTDIRCSAAVIDGGGLHVMNLELNNAARIDRQLHGRAARQGEPGSCQDILCLDDEVLVRELGVPGYQLLSYSSRYPHSAILRQVTRWIVRAAQCKAEARDRRIRLAVRDGQTRLQKMLAIGGYSE